MQFVFLSGNRADAEYLQKMLLRDDNELAFHGFHLTSFLEERGKKTFLKIETQHEIFSDGQELLLRYLLSGLIADYMISYWSKKILNRMAKKQYAYLGEQKCQEIAECCWQMGQKQVDIYQKKMWKTNIWQNVWDYFLDDGIYYLDVDGFMRFRLLDFCAQLKTALAKEVDHYLLDKEYEEFLDLMRAFVHDQEKLYDSVHLVWESPQHFFLLDEKGQELPLKQWAMDYPLYEMQQEEEIGDVLISALIQLAPKKLVVHTQEIKQSNILKTIKEIYRDQIELCTECAFCRSYFDKLKRKEYNK